MLGCHVNAVAQAGLRPLDLLRRQQDVVVADSREYENCRIAVDERRTLVLDTYQ